MVKILPEEIWRDIVGWEEYFEISTYGRCRSKTRISKGRDGRTIYVEGKLRKPMKSKHNSSNYNFMLQVKNYKATAVGCARLMYEAFIGPIPNNMQATIPYGKDCILENVVLVMKGSTKVSHMYKDDNKVPYKVGDTYRGCKIIEINRYYNVVHSSKRGDIQVPSYEFKLECSCGNIFNTTYTYRDRLKDLKCRSCKTKKNIKSIGLFYEEESTIGKVKLIKKLNESEFLCECGYCSKKFVGEPKNISRRKIPSCGCMRDNAVKELIKLGINFKHPLYIKYKRIINTCYKITETDKNYKIYRGKEKAYSGDGIKICKLWLNSFTEFYNWAINNGYDKDKFLSRIDSNGDFTPFNCQFISKSDCATKSNTYDILTKENEILYNIRKQAYKEKEIKWIKEMIKKGYDKNVL